MNFKKDGEGLCGEVNYDTVTESGLAISIGNIFSLTETGAYFDWGLEKCGFGQFSFSYDEVENKWHIMNECMGPESSYAIIKAFEESIHASGDEKAIYYLKKIISLIAYQSNSLSKSMLLIWNAAEKEGGEVVNFKKTRNEYTTSMQEQLDVEKSMLFCQDMIQQDNATLYSIATNNVNYTNKNGTFKDISIEIFFNIKEMKHGYVSVLQQINLDNGHTQWTMSEQVNEGLLINIIEALDKTEGEYQKIWSVWKNSVKLNDSTLNIANYMVEQSKKIKHRYIIK